jgi:hypothetical protein
VPVVQFNTPGPCAASRVSPLFCQIGCTVAHFPAFACKFTVILPHAFQHPTSCKGSGQTKMCKFQIVNCTDPHSHTPSPPSPPMTAAAATSAITIWRQRRWEWVTRILVYMEASSPAEACMSRMNMMGRPASDSSNEGPVSGSGGGALSYN